jgi:hypothetical protein
LAVALIRNPPVLELELELELAEAVCFDVLF